MAPNILGSNTLRHNYLATQNLLIRGEWYTKIFYQGPDMIEDISVYSFSDNFYFSSNIQYSLVDNFDDLEYPPVNTYPAQVRSDIKDYLKSYNQDIFIGRAQLDYYLTS